jgi:hypothetical protein
MAYLTVREILEKAEKASSPELKVSTLQRLVSFELKTYLQGLYNDKITFKLSEVIEYRKDGAPEGLHPSAPKPQFMRLASLVSGNKIDQKKKDMIFRSILEGVNGRDSELLIGMVKKKPDPEYPSITKDIAAKAFPELFK